LEDNSYEKAEAMFDITKQGRKRAEGAEGAEGENPMDKSRATDQTFCTSSTISVQIFLVLHD